jgi:thiol:disulfide interchange protein
VLLLDFTASWCPPCKAMEASTWHEPDVVEWIEREAVALKLDVDREFQRAAQMGVSGVPTIVFVSGEGRELGRFSGYRDAEGFLEQAALHSAKPPR